MPDTYCSTCQKVTAHKALMRRNTDHDSANGGVLQSFQQLMNQFINGEHYYKLEQQLFCRSCNCQSVSPADRSTYARLANHEIHL
ncbi:MULTISPECIES: hypothetical protein [Vibrio]|uniref:Uncharacterized protein n=1 Tax=Vibrio cortegadensis TaxID=1328770 RepID=A0ABV4M3F1_9VIBR|nr:MULTISPECIES: hypothetical protein [Vibrio]NOH82422.1 hypothetical protein [Vibrio sp. 03-59-1]RBW64753.1 hypothetical protein DS893_13815 [Vibrionales bacterium C3R12]TKF21539.1 hypothetical protein FCV43_09395 [Vibrio genomosp. F6]